MATTPGSRKKALNRAGPAEAKLKMGNVLDDLLTQTNLNTAQLAALTAKWNTANPGNTVAAFTNTQLVTLDNR